MTFVLDNFFVVGAVLGIAGCWATSLVLTYQMPGAPPTHLWQPKIHPDIANCPLKRKVIPNWERLAYWGDEVNVSVMCLPQSWCLAKALFFLLKPLRFQQPSVQLLYLPTRHGHPLGWKLNHDHYVITKSRRVSQDALFSLAEEWTCDPRGLLNHLPEIWVSTARAKGPVVLVQSNGLT